MTQNQIHVQPPLEFIPPDLQLPVVRALSGILPLYLRALTPVAEFQTENVERLVEMYRQFQSGEARFIVAFRHPNSMDPLSSLYLLSRAVPQKARELGVPLTYPTHAYYLYDRGIPLWAGAHVAWLLPRTGGISLFRGKMDRQSLKVARDKFANAEQPMMVAPEGLTNGMSEAISPLEPGTAQMAFWCLEDLRAAGRNDKVYIVPLGIRYSYITAPWEAIDRQLTQLESACGLAVDGKGATVEIRYQRLMRIAEYLLTTLEQYYVRFYHKTVDPSVTDFTARLLHLLEIALNTAEEFFAISSKGTVIDRCRRIEQAGWDRIYREDLKGNLQGNLKDQTLNPVERGLADRAAQEADLRMWHMRMVEGFVARVSGAYVQAKPTADRFGETIGLLFNTVNLLRGLNPYAAPSLGKQRVRMTVGEPILVDACWETYQSGRHGARQCVADVTQTLQEQLEGMMRQD